MTADNTTPLAPPVPTAPPAGVYPDPDGNLRHWDGIRWGTVASLSSSRPGLYPDPGGSGYLRQWTGSEWGVIRPDVSNVPKRTGAGTIVGGIILAFVILGIVATILAAAAGAPGY